MNGIADRIIEARERAGLTQTQLAEMCGMASTQLSRYELGKAVPRRATIRRLSEVLSIPQEWLLTGKTEPRNHHLHINLSQEELGCIEQLARDDGVDLQEMMRRLVLEALDRYESEASTINTRGAPIKEINQRLEALEHALEKVAPNYAKPRQHK